MHLYAVFLLETLWREEAWSVLARRATSRKGTPGAALAPGPCPRCRNWLLFMPSGPFEHHSEIELYRAHSSG